MNSVYKQITTIMTYLLQQNTNKSSENKQLLLLELSNEGDVQSNILIYLCFNSIGLKE